MRRRWRARAKWTLTLAAGFLAMVWALTLDTGVRVQRLDGASYLLVEVSAGAVLVSWGKAEVPARLRDVRFMLRQVLPYERICWWPRSAVGVAEGGVAVPLWMPLACAAVPAAALFWRRRARAGQCVCGYSRAGLSEGAACPECGVAP